MYDVFISYRRDGGYAMARLVYEHLLQMGFNPFWDFKGLRSGNFDAKLCKTIEECDFFLLVLPADALNRCSEAGDCLLQEITHAIDNEKTIIPLIMKGFQWPAQLPEAIATLPSYNWVDLSQDYFEAAMDKLLGMLTDTEIPQHRSAPQTAEHRYKNLYFTSEDKREIRRLRIQQSLMKQFDQAVYSQVLSRYPEARVLDVGCNNGDFIMDRTAQGGTVAKLIGLEYDPAAVNTANEKHAQADRIAFYCCDVESNDLAMQLEEIMEENSIDKFDILNISMLILHLKNPYKLLKTLRQYLRKGGSVIIKDIDDGLNLAFPDDSKYFQRVFDICMRNEESGFRHSGRQIYTLLHRAGFTDIRLERAGLSTIGMDSEKRSALFDVYFSFVLEDLKLMAKRYPLDSHIQADLQWYADYYDDLEQQFQDASFFFNLGFILFTAQK